MVNGKGDTEASVESKGQSRREFQDKVQQEEMRTGVQTDKWGSWEVRTPKSLTSYLGAYVVLGKYMPKIRPGSGYRVQQRRKDLRGYPKSTLTPKSGF